MPQWIQNLNLLPMESCIPGYHASVSIPGSLSPYSTIKSSFLTPATTPSPCASDGAVVGDLYSLVSEQWTSTMEVGVVV